MELRSGCCCALMNAEMEEAQQLRAELLKEREEKERLRQELQELRERYNALQPPKCERNKVTEHGPKEDKQKGCEKEEVAEADNNGRGKARGMAVRVLDLSRVLAGPYCSMLLADMGAEVIKLEIPKQGDDSRQFPPFKEGESLYYVNLNRGKKSISLDLKNPEGKRLFIELVKKSDIILENFSTGTMERLGLGYKQLKEVNPGIIYASITGFGHTGPFSNRPGYDIIAQAMSGLMSITGWPDSPPTRAGTAVGDVMAALFTTVGILGALQEKNQTGKGQMIDVSLVDALFASLGQHLQKLFIDGETPEKIGNRYEFIYPYDSFKAADGWIIIAIANDAIWHRFVECTAGIEGMGSLKSEEYATNMKRVDKHVGLKEIIEAWTQTQRVNGVVEFLNDNRIPACPILDLAEVSKHPHIALERRMVQKIMQPGIGEVKVLGNPIKMELTSAAPHGPAPKMGQHTEQILQEILGLSQEELLVLHRKDAI